MQNNLDGEESNQRRILYLNSKCVYTFNNSYTHSNFKSFIHKILLQNLVLIRLY